MPNRILIILTVLIWYVTVRTAVWHYFMPRVLSPGEKLEEFDWWFSWVCSIPLTAISIMIPGLMISFILHGHEFF
jgi:hypothetical protein